LIERERHVNKLEVNGEVVRFSLRRKQLRG